MSNLLRILLVLGMIIGGFIMVVSADSIPDKDFQIDFIIDDGNPKDMHDKNGWLVAGSGITSKIRVLYTGGNTGDKYPVIHYVNFYSVEKDKYGDVLNDNVTSTPFETVFSASKNTAGNAPIDVYIYYTVDDVGYVYYRTVEQKIDHNMPMRIQTLEFESEVTIDGTMEINLTMEDAYGNTVNSLYEDATSGTPEMVTFSTTLHAGSGFFDGTAYSAKSRCVPVKANGGAVAEFKVGTEAGPKYLIHLVPSHALNDKWLTITALANAEPYAIAVSVLPNVDTPPFIPADGESKFYLTYHLFDRYGNPSGNQTLHFTDSVLHDEFTRRTNSNGEVKFTFGPFDRVSLFNIHAYAMENTSVVIDQLLRFTNTSPNEMLLTANPQSMPSADVAPEFHASLLAKVMDESGNGVPNEVVQFSIVAGLWGEMHDSDPFLKDNMEVTDTVATTNVDGIATVKFTPGKLIKNVDEENKITPASENCTVVAKWGTKTRSIDLEWKNYPYLRVETEVSEDTVEVGDPVDVTIRLIGDGYALYPDPIDVMLCVDRSGSMLKGNPDRMVSLMTALKIFNEEMAEGRDAVGMTSFGKKGTASILSYSYRYWAGDDSTYNDDSTYINEHYKSNPKYYADHATLDLTLSTDRSLVNTTIVGLVPMDGTPMRGGLHLAIKEIIAHGRKNAVQAVILLSDGDYNTGGDPLARSGNYYDKFTDLSDPEQNMSVYAKNHNVTLYSIAFGNGLSVSGNATIKKLADSTDGNYYHAPDAEKLAAIYKEIAGELKTEAGVDTTMDLVFTNIELNNVSVVNDPADPFLKYEYLPGVSTHIKSWNNTATIMDPRTLDQRDDWAANQSLNFNITDIGTIHLGQTWQAVFRLNVLQAGNINIFGEGSSLSFNDGEGFLTLPKTYITAVPNLNATGINFTGLQVENLTCIDADNGVITDYLKMEWNLSYSGNYTVTQDLFYQKESDGMWNRFDTKTVPFSGSEPLSNCLQIGQLYVADFPPGKYLIRVHAKAVDTPDSIVQTLLPITIGQGGGFFIKLE